MLKQRFEVAITDHIDQDHHELYGVRETATGLWWALRGTHRSLSELAIPLSGQEQMRRSAQTLNAAERQARAVGDGTSGVDLHLLPSTATMTPPRTGPIVLISTDELRNEEVRFDNYAELLRCLSADQQPGLPRYRPLAFNTCGLGTTWRDSELFCDTYGWLISPGQLRELARLNERWRTYRHYLTDVLPAWETVRLVRVVDGYRDTPTGWVKISEENGYIEVDQVSKFGTTRTRRLPLNWADMFA